jgi:VanZ family protein
LPKAKSIDAVLPFLFCIQRPNLSCYDWQMAENLAAPQLTIPERIVRYWIPVGLMLCLMYVFSTDLFSGQNTQRLIDWVVSLLWGDDGKPSIRTTNFLVRKFAHFFEYAVLAALLFRAFRAESRIRWRLSWAGYSFSIVVIWALLDEFHQSFTKFRGSSIYDSLIDSAGGLCSLSLIALYAYLRRRKRDSRIP